MKGVNGGVPAAAPSLRRKLTEQARKKGAHRRQQHDHQRTQRRHLRFADQALAVRAKRRVAAEVPQQEVLRVLQAGEEPSADQARGHADQRGVKQRSPQQAQVQRWGRDTQGGAERQSPEESPGAPSPPDSETERQAAKASCGGGGIRCGAFVWVVHGSRRQIVCPIGQRAPSGLYLMVAARA